MTDDDDITRADGTRVVLAELERLSKENARLIAALDELHAAVKDHLGTMDYYCGPNAQTAVSGESIKAYNRIVAALDAATRGKGSGD